MSEINKKISQLLYSTFELVQIKKNDLPDYVKSTLDTYAQDVDMIIHNGICEGLDECEEFNDSAPQTVADSVLFHLDELIEAGVLDPEVMAISAKYLTDTTLALRIDLTYNMFPYVSGVTHMALIEFESKTDTLNGVSVDTGTIDDAFAEGIIDVPLGHGIYGKFRTKTTLRDILGV